MTNTEAFKLQNNSIIQRNDHSYEKIKAAYFTFPDEFGSMTVYLRVFEEEYDLDTDISMHAGYNIQIKDF